MDYETWVRAAFDSDESREDSYSANDLPTSEERIEYLTRLFRLSGVELARYSDEQVADGLGFLQQEELWRVGDTSVAWKIRESCLYSIYNLYSGVFVPRCVERLGHYSEEMGKLNGVCYMWWEIGCWIDVEDATLVETVVEVLGQILTLPHAACQESALHGLGHWGLYFPEAICPPIDAFLASNTARRRELVAYAKAARESQIL